MYCTLHCSSYECNTPESAADAGYEIVLSHAYHLQNNNTITEKFMKIKSCL